MADLRTKIRAKTKATTTFGYGPRYLHSTGQYHKGGPPNGVFVQLYHRADEDVEIPDAGYGFEHLKLAQALGDAQTLREHGLTVVRVELEGDPAEAIGRARRSARLVGLGKMGANMVHRHHRDRSKRAWVDFNADAVSEAGLGAAGSSSSRSWSPRSRRRARSVMAVGRSHQQTVDTARACSPAGDTIIDGGIRADRRQAPPGASPPGDPTTSKGVEAGCGHEVGYCMRVGGPTRRWSAYADIDVSRSASPPRSTGRLGHFGTTGPGTT